VTAFCDSTNGGNVMPHREKTRPGRCPEPELIALRTLMINQVREVFCQKKLLASLIYILVVSPWPSLSRRLYAASPFVVLQQAPSRSRHRTAQVVMDGSLTDRTSSGDLPLPQPRLKAEAGDFLNLTHGLCSREHNPCNVAIPVMCPPDCNCHISIRKPLSADT